MSASAQTEHPVAVVAAAPGGVATLPPVSTLLRVGGSHQRNSASSSSVSPPCSPRTPAGALLPEPEFIRAAAGSSSSRSPTLASLGTLLVASEQAGKRRPPPPPLSLQPLSSLGKPNLGRQESDERCSIRSLLNGNGNVTPRTAKRPTPVSSRAHSPQARSAESERHHFAYGPPPPSAPGRHHSRTEYHPPPPAPATAPAQPDYHQLHHYHPDMRRHSYQPHPQDYYPPPPHHYAPYPPPPHHAQQQQQQQHPHPHPHPHQHPHPHPHQHPYPPSPYDATVFYPPPGMPYDPMSGLGARAPISRTTKACDACRARKVRCDAGGYPSAQGTCSRCRESGRTCVYTATQKKRGPCPGRPSRVSSSGSSGRRASLESTPTWDHRQNVRSAPAHPVDAWPWGPGPPPAEYERHHPYKREMREMRTAPLSRQPVGGWEGSYDYAMRPHEGAGWPDSVSPKAREQRPQPQRV